MLTSKTAAKIQTAATSLTPPCTRRWSQGHHRPFAPVPQCFLLGQLNSPRHPSPNFERKISWLFRSGLQSCNIAFAVHSRHYHCWPIFDGLRSSDSISRSPEQSDKRIRLYQSVPWKIMCGTKPEKKQAMQRSPILCQWWLPRSGWYETKVPGYQIWWHNKGHYNSGYSVRDFIFPFAFFQWFSSQLHSYWSKYSRFSHNHICFCTFFAAIRSSKCIKSKALHCIYAHGHELNKIIFICRAIIKFQ